MYKRHPDMGNHIIILFSRETRFYLFDPCDLSIYAYKKCEYQVKYQFGTQ